MAVLNIIEPTFDFNYVDPYSKLLISGDKIIDSNCHTSIGDMTTEEIFNIADQFESINFVSQGFDATSDTYKESVILMNALRHKKPVTGYSPEPVTQFLSKNVADRPDSPVLWVFGCSHSHGIGLRSNEKTFGQIVADALEIPLLKITQPGSSLSWSFRHLINADIKPSDRVIWQITTPIRISRVTNGYANEVILSETVDRCLLDVHNDDQLFFNHINLLTAGVRYLRAINSQFLLTDLISPHHNFYEYKLEYLKYPEYLYHPNLYLDLGTDKVHVGPLSHQALAQRILDHVYYMNDQSI
jgi:hypothetical protein